MWGGPAGGTPSARFLRGSPQRFDVTRDRPRVQVVAVAAVALAVFASSAAAQSAATCTLNVVCEAETGTLHDGAGTEDEHAGYTGTGFVDQLFGAAGVKLTVNATEATSHRITVRYANANPGNGVASRRFTLTVNGTTDIPMLFPPTSSWATWSTVTVLVPLKPGSTSSTSAPAPRTTGRSTSTTSSSRRPRRSPRTASRFASSTSIARSRSCATSSSARPRTSTCCGRPST